MGHSLLHFVSRTGNTQTFIPFLTDHAANEIDLYNSDINISDYSQIAIGAYSWGNGKIPKDMKQWLIDNQDHFRGKRIFIFGSGYSVYPKFCGALDGIKQIVTDCGATVEGIFRFEQRFHEEEMNEQERFDLIQSIHEWSK